MAEPEIQQAYLGWAQEPVKRNLPLVNETLGRLITLNTTLTGGNLFLLASKLDLAT